MLRSENGTITGDAAEIVTTSVRTKLALWLGWDQLVASVLQSHFVRNVLLLSGGTVLGQAILVLSAPLLTRLYQPEDLGVLAVFISTISLLVVVAALRYEVAIPLPKDDKQAANIFVLSLASVGAMTALVSLAIWLFGSRIITRLDSGMPAWFLWLVPLGLCGAGLHGVLSTWLVRQRDYSQLAATSVIQALAQAVGQVGLGLWGMGTLGLLVGDVFGRTSGSGTLSRRCWRMSRGVFCHVTPAGILEAAGRYWRFPVLSSWAALLNTAAVHLPPVLFAILYDVKVVGWLALAQRILGMPTTLLSNSVAKVYFSEFARLRHDAPERLERLFWRTVAAQTFVAMLMVICVALPAPLVCGWIFGEEWRAAGWCVLILSAMFAAKLIAYPLGATLDVLEMQGWHIIRELLRLTLTVGAVGAAAILRLEPLAAAGVLSIASCLAYCLGIVIAWRVIQGVSPKHEP